MKIAKQVECEIVIGGYNIENIEILDAICREIQPRIPHIETSQELNPRWLSRREENRFDSRWLDPSLEH